MASLTNNKQSLWIQLFRYGVVGGISFAVDWGVLMFCTDVIGIHYLLSAAISFILGLICNYTLSTRWVFGKSRISNKWAEFGAFAIIGIVGLLLNEIIMFVATDIADIHYLASKAISTSLVFVWNFLGRRFMIYTS